MSLARSRITAQGQISVPATVRRKLGVGPGSILVWDEEQGRIVVRQAGTCSSQAIHAVLFPEGSPERRNLAELKDGLRKHVQKKHKRG